MKTEIYVNEGIFRVVLHDRLDTLTAPELESELKARITGKEYLVFDLADLEYISSAGLRVLIWAYKAVSAEGGFKIVNVNDTVYEVLEITGLADILEVER